MAKYGLLLFQLPTGAQTVIWGSDSSKTTAELWNLFPRLRFPVRLEERVKRLAIHAGLARRGADVAVATSQQRLGVRELEARQVLVARLFPRKAGKVAGRAARLQIVSHVFRLQNTAGVKRRQLLHQVLELPHIARPGFAEKRFIESRRRGQALAVAPGKSLQEKTGQVRDVFR